MANEFLDPNIGRLGGFGWAASRAADVFNKSQSGFEAVFLTPLLYSHSQPGLAVTNGTRLLYRSGRRYKDSARLLYERIDILLTIDYRTDYNVIFDCAPLTPIVTWVRDPRSPADIDKMMSLRIPGSKKTALPGLHTNNTRDLSKYIQPGRLFKRPVILGNKMPYLSAKHTSVYGLPPTNHELPNPDLINYQEYKPNASGHPRVIYLGRLDPIKRPWLFIELARNFPEVEFLMLGKDHFADKGGWTPEDIPENVKILGHLSGKKKYDLCASAWVLVNTSIHEESPVSVFEALASETPVLSYEDWGGIVERFGIAIGQHRGTGLEGIPSLTEGLDQLLREHSLRHALGRAGHLHVRQEYTDRRFLGCFRDICKAAGLTLPGERIRPSPVTLHETSVDELRTLSEEP